MRIAVYGREFNTTVLPFVQDTFRILDEYGVEIVIYDKFYEFINDKITLPSNYSIFSKKDSLSSDRDILISLGGDGTLLDTLALVRNSGTPVVGINFGRMGFLASVNKTEIEMAIAALVSKQYTIDHRSLLSIESGMDLFDGENYALNDVTIHRRDNSAMMIIHAYMDGEFINSYWADGLITATPTGSTAYSLSCGGPIIYPSAENFVITPVAPHNLNVRPLLVPDNVSLAFEIEARSTKFLVSCDSRMATVARTVKITLSKADFYFNLIRLNNESYLTTLRKKLLWGIDTRNY